jgi:hypothetical protein
MSRRSSAALNSPSQASSSRLLLHHSRAFAMPGIVFGTVVFKTTAIDHSAIPPRELPSKSSILRRTFARLVVMGTSYTVTPPTLGESSRHAARLRHSPIERVMSSATLAPWRQPRVPTVLFPQPVVARTSPLRESTCDFAFVFAKSAQTPPRQQKPQQPQERPEEAQVNTPSEGSI